MSARAFLQDQLVGQAAAAIRERNLQLELAGQPYKTYRARVSVIHIFSAVLYYRKNKYINKQPWCQFLISISLHVTASVEITTTMQSEVGLPLVYTTSSSNNSAAAGNQYQSGLYNLRSGILQHNGVLQRGGHFYRER